MNTKLIIFLSCFTLAIAVQKCYDCNPTPDGKCEDPVSNNIATIQCESTQEKNNEDNTAVAEFECYSFHLDSSNDTIKGFYRGCIDKKIGVDNCYNFREQYANITRCTVCQTDKCNTLEDFNGGNSSITVTINILIFIVTCVTVLM